MSERATDFQFIEVSADEIISKLTAKYEEVMSRTVHPSSPEKLFLSWVAAAIVQIYQNINFAANQNLPSRATGTNLDALAQLFQMKTRPEPTPAYATMKFTISESQGTTIIVPAGTRVTTTEGDPIFETIEDATIAIGSTSTTVQAVCQTSGTVGNGYAAGQINECVDLFTYYESCENTATSDGGSDAPDDDEFFELLKSSENAFSCAGPRGAYKYWAKSVSTEIADVVVNSPDPGEVYIYALMNDGTKAGSTIKSLISAACNDDNVRPLTDTVVVDDPDEVTYTVNITFYYSTNSEMSAADIEAAVTAAVDEYVAWQSGKLGRDINPSKLIQMVVNAGAKRVVVTSPAFTSLDDGSGSDAPELAKCTSVTITNGGAEDE